MTRNGAQKSAGAERADNTLLTIDPLLLKYLHRWVELMSSLPDTPSGALKVNGHAYAAACDRVLHHVVALVHARGVEMSLDIDPGRAPFEVITNTHQIQLTYGRSVRIVSVDHETFMDEEFFKTLVLHQLERAIDELASGT